MVAGTDEATLAHASFENMSIDVMSFPNTHFEVLTCAAAAAFVYSRRTGHQ